MIDPDDTLSNRQSHGRNLVGQQDNGASPLYETYGLYPAGNYDEGPGIYSIPGIASGTGGQGGMYSASPATGPHQSENQDKLTDGKKTTGNKETESKLAGNKKSTGQPASKPKAKPKTIQDQMKEFYGDFGTSVINALHAMSPSSNKYKALYIIAQRRAENGMNSKPPGNNPFNVMGKGDAGQVSEKTTEYNSKTGVTSQVTEKFASFSTLEKGTEGYLNVLQESFPKAFEALTDNSKTIYQFTYGLIHQGKNGVYATGKDYDCQVEKIFAEVLRDYKKDVTSQINSNTAQIKNLEAAENSMVITIEYKTEIPQMISDLQARNIQLNRELAELNQVK